MTILTLTGHRAIDVPAFSNRLRATFEEVQPTALIQGMADGADLVGATIAINLGIAVISAMPWLTHYKTTKHLSTYRWVLDHSEEVFPVSEAEEYLGPWLFHQRNQWMVDEGDRVVAWFDGRQKGGTYGAIKYANKVGKPVRNIYDY